MTIQRINALRGLEYKQLVNLAIQRKLIPNNRFRARQWSSDSLRLKLIDSICAEELAAPGYRKGSGASEVIEQSRWFGR